MYLESKAGSLVCLLAKDELGAELDEAEAEVDDPELDEWFSIFICSEEDSWFSLESCCEGVAWW